MSPKRKAAIELEVRIIIDFGSNATFKEAEIQLKHAGIKIFRFNPFKPIVSGIYNNRDHRKIAIIDHKYAFTGGMNLADEYANVINRFGYWKDTMIRIQGKAITNLIILFLETYDSFANTKSDYKQYCSKVMKKWMVMVSFSLLAMDPNHISKSMSQKLCTSQC